MITPLLTGHYHPIKPTRFKPFGCQAYVLNHEASKLDPTAKKMIFVGLEPGSNAYRLWDKSTRRITVSADLRFDETSFPAIGHSLTPTDAQITDIFPDLLASLSTSHHNPTPVSEDSDIREIEIPSGSTEEILPSIPEEAQALIPDVEDNHEEEMSQAPEVETVVRRSTRQSCAPIRYGYIT